MSMIEMILKNPAFWAALIALVNALLDYFLPAFPNEIKTALNGLLVVVFGAISGAQIVNARRAQKASAEKIKLERIAPK